MKIFQVQFHTGFVEQDAKFLRYSRKELDHLDTADKYQESFSVSVEVAVASKEKRQPDQSFPWENFNNKSLSPKILFSSPEEHAEVIERFGNICLTLGPLR